MFNRIVRAAVVVGLLSLSAAGCRGPERIVVAGHSVDPRTYRESKETVEKMFASDVACPADAKTVTILGVDHEEVTELGVAGCSKKRVYLRIKDTKSGWGNVREWSAKWTLSTKSSGEPAEF